MLRLSQVDRISLGSSASSCSSFSTSSSWQTTGSRSWKENLQAASPSPAGGGSRVAPFPPAGDQKSLRVPDVPNLQYTLLEAPPSAGGRVAPRSPKSPRVSDQLHLHSSSCAITPPPTPSPTLSAGSAQHDVSFSFVEKKIHEKYCRQELLKVVPGEFKDQPAKKRLSGWTEAEWVRKSSGPGKVRFVPISVPGGRILHRLVCTFSILSYV